MRTGTHYRRRGLWVALCICLVSASAVPAHAQFWNKKDYRHWSKKECEKLLSNSPWAKVRSFGQMQMPNGFQDTQAAAIPQGVPSSNQAATPGRQAIASISYTAIFFSALPVREAQVRLGQIQSHYDKMSPEQKKAFDQNAARYLAVAFPNDVVVQVTYSTNVESFWTSLDTFWQMETTAKLKQDSYLAVKGTIDRLRRYEFTPKQHAFFLFFPRQVNGKAVLQAGQKSLTLQVTRSVLQVANAPGNAGDTASAPPPSGNITLSFDVRKMMYKGKVAY